MSYEYYVLEAVERALAWGFSVDELGRVVVDQASLLASDRPDQIAMEG